jgi:hypothetical protein
MMGRYGVSVFSTSVSGLHSGVANGIKLLFLIQVFIHESLRVNGKKRIKPF